MIWMQLLPQEVTEPYLAGAWGASHGLNSLLKHPLVVLAGDLSMELSYLRPVQHGSSGTRPAASPDPFLQHPDHENTAQSSPEHGSERCSNLEPSAQQPQQAS